MNIVHVLRKRRQQLSSTIAPVPIAHSLFNLNTSNVVPQKYISAIDIRK